MASPSAFTTTRPGQPQAAGLRGTVLSPAFLAFAALTVMLGTNYVAVRVSNGELMPLWGAGLRFTVAALALFVVTRLRGLSLPTGRALAGAVLYGLLVFAVFYALLYNALLYVPAGMVSMVMATGPLLTLFMAVLARQEQFRWQAGLGGAAAVAGVGLVFWEQLRADVPPAGLALALLGAASAALSVIVVKRFARGNPIATNTVAMAAGAAVLLAVSRAQGEPWVLPALPATWAALAWLVFTTCTSFVLMVWVLQRWSASAVSYNAVLQPLVTVGVAAWLVGEQVTLLFAVGAALALVGVYFGALRQAPETKA